MKPYDVGRQLARLVLVLAVAGGAGLLTALLIHSL